MFEKCQQLTDGEIDSLVTALGLDNTSVDIDTQNSLSTLPRENRIS